MEEALHNGTEAIKPNLCHLKKVGGRRRYQNDGGAGVPAHLNARKGSGKARATPIDSSDGRTDWGRRAGTVNGKGESKGPRLGDRDSRGGKENRGAWVP